MAGIGMGMKNMCVLVNMYTHVDKHICPVVAHGINQGNPG